MNPNAAAADNSDGLEAFAAANPLLAERKLRRAYLHWAEERGILVNLGLACMQQGKVALAERCYRLAARSSDLRTRRSAHKNLGFLHLWRGQWQPGWRLHGCRFEGEGFLDQQWSGQPLNGKPLLVWNDVGMGDVFQFVRYTQALTARGERVILAVHPSQIELFRQYLAWPLEAVVDRNRINLETSPHIPLMNLVGLIDPTTVWGRHWRCPTWRLPTNHSSGNPQPLGLCWASNPQDQSMHHYKSLPAELLLQRLTSEEQQWPHLSLQTDEAAAHQRLGLEPPQRCWIQTLLTSSYCRQVHSVDTAVAHLAAGANVTVNLHLAAMADWRWQGLAPHWYPSLKIYQGSGVSP
ncbi:hypothetical protein KBY58_04240 [Cyanobium sp. HWJ4-Hawea]|uniref:tetratricopeptide repeat protein n=1 Tax=Cyanobium sp. HWJ4-Hawea TaxID=2823713 RepID=UPI0020CFE7B9|nr:hypothetical protein [Cyanobium sp. HWJ4-Hawea]MCP9808641.1 hypothetical protein [Cyanobium sp. HWJ4-Hawea]